MNKLILSFSVISVLLFTSCNNDDDNTSQEASLTLNINGLQYLGDDFRYEGWLIVNGSAVTTGVFSVNELGQMSSNTFNVAANDLNEASKFVLTIEPYPDTDLAPSSTHILAGDFSGNSATLSIGAPEALGNDFSDSMGKYILATPSNGAETNETSGVWFLGALPPTAGLDLPTLPAGWKYEGWAVINGIPVSTGTFTDVAATDSFSGFSGDMATPPFPGEDFLMNAPTGLTFPTDLSGAKVVISIEPSPDNSPAPFVLKPLLADVPANVQDHVVYDMDNIMSLNAPTGTAQK